MPRHRKNKARKQTDGEKNAPWFTNNVKRQRRRNEIAKESRRKNR